ncbi:MAG: hypothetical protein ACYCQJ_00810 [Nitrososphaerales archaeon]
METSRKYGKSKTSVLFVTAFLGIAILILAIFNNQSFGMIQLLFGLIFLEGIMVFIIVVAETSVIGDPFVRRRNNGADILRTSKNGLETQTYVRFASGGSDFSRTQIARVIRRIILQRSGSDLADQGNQYITLLKDDELRNDLSLIVLPYLSDVNATPNKERHVGREAYLASLNRIISKLA